jgi:hypothetical protein
MERIAAAVAVVGLAEVAFRKMQQQQQQAQKSE